MSRTSILIPLYRSAPFFAIICDNIDSHLAVDCEVLVSDCHLHDDTASRLQARYGHDERVSILTGSGQENWVDNINKLIAAAGGDYLRIVPHDDTASAESTQQLREALERHPDAVLAYGITRAIDLEGRPMPERDTLNERESPDQRDWSLDDALSLFWSSRCLGAFKGVVRAAALRSPALPIKKTATLVCSERAWLFALALRGRLHFVPEATLIKRYYAGSTSSTWQYTQEVYREVERVMHAYCNELMSDARMRALAQANISANAGALIDWLGATQSDRPAYIAL
jgi:hypothetical protein